MKGDSTAGYCLQGMEIDPRLLPRCLHHSRADRNFARFLRFLLALRFPRPFRDSEYYIVVFFVKEPQLVPFEYFPVALEPSVVLGFRGPCPLEEVKKDRMRPGSAKIVVQLIDQCLRLYHLSRESVDDGGTSLGWAPLI